jgi:hypothetical protein
MLRWVVQSLDDVRVALRDDAAPNLARTRHLGVVGVQLLVEEHESLHARSSRQSCIGAPDLVGDESIDLRFLGEVRVGRIGDIVVFRPFADVRHIDIEQRRDVRTRLPAVG